MPNINKIAETMKMNRAVFPQEIFTELGFDKDGDVLTPGKSKQEREAYKQQEFELLTKLNDLLTLEQKFAIMEQKGCCKTSRMDKESKDFGKTHVDKTIAEKLQILSSGNSAPSVNDDGTRCYALPTDKDAPCMNDDGTISYAVVCFNLDSEKALSSCHCLRRNYQEEFLSFAREHHDKVCSFMQFFCGCCAGHQKHHLQNKLGVKLKLKSVTSSSIKTDKGYKRVFIYEVKQS
ncbi:MAG: hypothetical protein FWC92_10060 [Defluviitaleaceae bacterium]|nr:hypothetical protein [Defluviitaleaceae bacterium]